MHILDQLKDAFSRLVRHKSACTISAFRKSYLAEIGGGNCHPTKIETEKIKAGEIQISQMRHRLYHEATR
jgi:hypothetical protein